VTARQVIDAGRLSGKKLGFDVPESEWGRVGPPPAIGVSRPPDSDPLNSRLASRGCCERGAPTGPIFCVLLWSTYTVVFTPSSPSHRGSVWLLPAISLLSTNTVSPHSPVHAGMPCHMTGEDRIVQKPTHAILSLLKTL